MSDLTVFLDARLSEDEADARKATLSAIAEGTYAHPEWSKWEYELDGEVCYVGSKVGYSATYPAYDHEGLLPAMEKACGPHIARWDPARVLAECAAKRFIVELAESMQKLDELGNGPYKNAGAAEAAILGDVLRSLASVYADHPDYRPEWRP